MIKNFKHTNFGAKIGQICNLNDFKKKSVIWIVEDVGDY